MHRKLSTLLIEDEPAEANALRHRLAGIAEPEIHLAHVDSLASAESALAAGSFDAIVTDLSLPDSFGVESVVQLKSMAPDTPIVVLSANDDFDLEIETIKAGAQSYALKGVVDPNVLARLISHAVERQELQAEVRRQTEAKAQLSAQFREAMESGSDAVLVIDQAGVARFANLASETLFGRAKDDLIGEQIGMPSDGGKEFELSILRPDGRALVADMRVSPTLWDGEQMSLAILRDVTPRKELEEALREDAARAAASAQAKSAFLSQMSHELRTPLNCILGYVDLVRSELHGTIEDAQHKEYLDIAAKAGEELVEMVSNILDLAKLDADRMSLNEAQFSVDVLLRECALTAAPLIKNAGLTCDVESKKCSVQADETRVRQVVMNFMSNACKFTKPGGRITIRAGVSQNGQLEVAVTDTGLGIARPDLPKVFKEFEQVGRSATRPQEGAGLGLAICKQFIELHGGSIFVKSVRGAGSTFGFTLPAERVVSGEVLEHPNSAAGRLRSMWR